MIIIARYSTPDNSFIAWAWAVDNVDTYTPYEALTAFFADRETMEILETLNINPHGDTTADIHPDHSSWLIDRIAYWQEHSHAPT